MTDIVERLRSVSPSRRLNMHGEAADEIERLRETLKTIYAWSQAYPIKAFPKPDLKRAAELLRAGGMTLDAVSADAMRHVATEVGKMALHVLGDK